MSRLITFGCSLTQFKGKKEHLANLLGVENINMAHPAGSNQLQVKYLHDMITNNEVDKSDLVYWQITSFKRPHKRLSMNLYNTVEKIQQEFTKKNRHHYIINKHKNIFDTEKRIDLLSISSMIEQEFDHLDELSTLLGTLILLKSYCPKLIVSFGWKSVIPNPYFDIFTYKLKQNSIDFIEEPFLEYTKRNNLPTLNDLHPAPSAGVHYAEHVLYKRIKDLGWL